MTLDDVKNFQDDTYELLGDNNEMIRRLQTPNQYINTKDITDLLQHNLKQLNIYYRYMQIDYIIEKERSGNDGA